MKIYYRLISAFMALAAMTGASAEAPAGYYSKCEGKKGEALLSTLQSCIDNHKNLGYPAMWTMYGTTDIDANGKIWDIYSTKRWDYPAGQCGSASTGGVGTCYNREHSFPKSWFGGEVAPMFSDGFHIYPADRNVNSQRNNFPYGECANGTRLAENDGVRPTGKLGKCTFAGYTGTVFEPDDELKGDLARGYFYMATRYYGQLSSWNSEMLDGSSDYPAFTSWALNLLLKWHRQDPVSQKELDRNEAVYALQKNRNPFIDHPELVEYIWGNKTAEGWGAEDVPSPEFNKPVDGAAYDLGQVCVGAHSSVAIPLLASHLVEGVAMHVVWTPGSMLAPRRADATTTTVEFDLEKPWDNENITLSEGQSWGNTYGNVLNLNFAEGTVSGNFAKPNAGNSIEDYPCVKACDVIVTVASGTITAATIECVQWGSKTKNFSLSGTSTDGINYADYSGDKCSTFTLTTTNLPDGTVALKYTFEGNNQVGIGKITLTVSTGSGDNNDPGTGGEDPGTDPGTGGEDPGTDPGTGGEDPGQEETILPGTYTFTDPATLTPIISLPAPSNGTDLTALDSNHSHLSFDKGGATAGPRVWNASGSYELRIYSKNILTVSVDEAYRITSVEFTGSGITYTAAPESASSDDAKVWTAAADSELSEISFTWGASGKIKTLIVNYEKKSQGGEDPGTGGEDPIDPPVEPFVPVESDVTFDFTAPATWIAQAVLEASTGYNLDGLSITTAPVTIAFVKGEGSTSPRFWLSGGAYSLRLYSNSTTTISVLQGYRLKGIEMEGSSFNFIASNGIAADDHKSWTPDANAVVNEVTFTWAKQNSNNPRLTAMTVLVETTDQQASSGIVCPFTIDVDNISAADAMGGTTVNVTFAPRAIGTYTAQLLLTSGSLTRTVALTGECVAGMRAADATDITTESFVAHWVDIDHGTETYRLYVKEDNTVLAGYPVAVPSADCAYTVTGLEPQTCYTYYVERASDGAISPEVSVTTNEEIPEIVVSIAGAEEGVNTVVFGTKPGEPSNAATIEFAALYIDDDMEIAVDSPFEVSFDLNNWSDVLRTDTRADHVYVRVNTDVEGEYTSTLFIKSGFVADAQQQPKPRRVASSTTTEGGRWTIVNDDITLRAKVNPKGTTDVELNVADTDWEAYAIDGDIVVDNRLDAPVAINVYTLDGYEVTILKAAPGTSTHRLAPGFYLLVRDNQARRVLLK